MAGLFFITWDKLAPDPHDYYDDPDPCPICGGIGWVEDEEGWTTDCPCTRDPDELTA